jgi:hypothetical protein
LSSLYLSKGDPREICPNLTRLGEKCPPPQVAGIFFRLLKLGSAIPLLSPFPQLPFLQPYSRTPAILVDKLNPGPFKRTSHRQVIGHGHGSFILRTLCPLDSRNAQRGFTGKVFGAPP